MGASVLEIQKKTPYFVPLQIKLNKKETGIAILLRMYGPMFIPRFQHMFPSLLTSE
jgi:hypothetical protein